MQRLENGDTVIVPLLGSEITIEGMVRRPAIYEQKNEKSLADVIALAGGLLPTATMQHIEVQRTIAHDKQTMLNWTSRSLIPRVTSLNNWNHSKYRMLTRFAFSPSLPTRRMRFISKGM